LSRRENEFELERTTINDISHKLLDSKNTEIDELSKELSTLRLSKLEIEKTIEALEESNRKLQTELAEVKAASDRSMQALSDTFASRIESLNDQIESVEIEKNAFLKQNESLVIFCFLYSVRLKNFFRLRLILFFFSEIRNPGR
jgi:SMC interacting uncharacterized protein involved in chromosome segregation